MSKFQVQLPQEVHRGLKVASAMKGWSMQEFALVAFRKAIRAEGVIIEDGDKEGQDGEEKDQG